jgi:hypothetical protein
LPAVAAYNAVDCNALAPAYGGPLPCAGCGRRLCGADAAAKCCVRRIVSSETPKGAVGDQNCRCGLRARCGVETTPTSRRLVPSCRPCPRRVVVPPPSTQTNPYGLDLTQPHVGYPSRLPSAALWRRNQATAQSERASAWTGPHRLCGRAGHDRGGPRLASQAAHTADPYARKCERCRCL